MIFVKPILITDKPTNRGHLHHNWGGIQTQQQIEEEKKHILAELVEISSRVPQIKFLPLAHVTEVTEVLYKIPDIKMADVIVIYGAGGTGSIISVPGFIKELVLSFLKKLIKKIVSNDRQNSLLISSLLTAISKPGKALQNTAIPEAIASFGKPTVMFVRHRSGPLYLYYEIYLPRFLRKETDDLCQAGMTVEDVIVDDYQKLVERIIFKYKQRQRQLKRFKKLAQNPLLKNIVGAKIVFVGLPIGFGYRFQEIVYAQYRWGFDIQIISYEELGRIILESQKNPILMREVYHEAEKFLALKQITIKVKKELVINAFLLAKVFEDLMKKYGAKIITIGQCASVVLPVSETTSCLALSILNNRGYTACCEGDMATLPAMLVLQRISNQPVFMNDPTIPHEGIVTVAHCTAPILMDGQTIEPSEIVPHFETGLGAAVRVNMPQKEVTIIDPDFKNKKWIIFTGQIIETPKLPICRTQLEIKIQGDWQKLLKEMCGFHWVLTYGNHLSELKRVAKLIGIRLVVI